MLKQQMLAEIKKNTKTFYSAYIKQRLKFGQISIWQTFSLLGHRKLLALTFWQKALSGNIFSQHMKYDSPGTTNVSEDTLIALDFSPIWCWNRIPILVFQHRRALCQNTEQYVRRLTNSYKCLVY